MKRLAVKPLAIAIALINGTLVTPSIFAQDNQASSEEQIIEEVSVIGYRASLENSLEAKRNATGVVDAIFAEDIADFPDNNLAESMQRIPGVAITRTGGEGRQISVRGLGPAFTRVRVNGMEAMSSTGSTDAEGGNNRGRGFDFNTFSSDLFSQLMVRKTNSADVDEGSLGATVDLRTARPMDYKDSVLSISGKLGYNDQSEETDPGVSLLASKIFTDTFGALVSVSYSERSVLDEGSSTVRWSSAEDFGDYTGTNPDKSLEEINGVDPFEPVFHPRIPRYDSYTHTIERTGAAVTLQFQPSDSTDFALDLLYSKHDATRNEVFLQGVGNSAGIVSGYNVQDYEIEGNTIVYADIPNATLRSENRYDALSTEFTQVTLTATHEFSDRLRLNALLGSAQSDHQNPIQNTIILQANGVGMTWDYRGGHDNTALTFGDGAYNAANWVMSGIRQRPQETLNEFTNATADLSFDIDEVFTITGGISVKSFDFDSTQSRFASEGANGIDSQTEGYITTYDSGLGDGQAWLIPNRALIVEQENVLSNSGDFALVQRNSDTFSVSEDTLSLFVQLDFDTQLGEVPFSGNVGVRQFSTDQSSTGWFNTGGAEDEQLWIDHSYDDILPSMNLKFEPIEDVVIRFSASEGISRASLLQLKADQNVTVSGSLRAVSGGNPFLEPTKARSFDTSIELYFNEYSAMTTTVFRKDIESHIQTLKDEKTLTELGIPAEEAEAACGGSAEGYGASCNENLLWQRSVPLNGPGGDLHGFEIGYQTTFGFLGDWASNFGILGNYTYVKSQLAYLDEDGNVEAIADLLDLSEVTQSVTLYYEDDRFSARIAWVDRSDYLDDAVGRNGNVQEGTYGTSNIDFSASYMLTERLKITLEGLNLTNEADNKYVDRSDYRLSYYHETGTQFYLGAQYKF